MSAPFAFRHLQLSRPLVVLDLETTGKEVSEDRIVEICVLKLHPDGSSEKKTRLLNPGVPISPGATKVHGITDAEVQDKPTFRNIAKGLAEFLEGCDICGFNVVSFDLAILQAEFHRAGVTFTIEGRGVVDAMILYQRMNPRSLASAVKQYLHREHLTAHRAEADVLATAELVEAMMEKHSELPRTVEELQRMTNRKMAIGVSRMLTVTQGEVRFVKGKHRGQPLEFVARTSTDYLHWMLNADLCEATKATVRKALDQRTTAESPSQC